MQSSLHIFRCSKSFGNFQTNVFRFWRANPKVPERVGQAVLFVSLILSLLVGQRLANSSLALGVDRETQEQATSFGFSGQVTVAQIEKTGSAQTEQTAGPGSRVSSGSSPSAGQQGDQTFAWQSLFDGKQLGKWAITRFGGEGEVTVKDGTIILGMGNPMTGITWTGEVIRDNYELQFEAKRTSGIDFFATTTFPVGEEYCSFVVGGWAGTVVGLSCINNLDASENETTQFKVFEDNRWYRIRIRVSQAKVECWIDDEKMVDVKREGRKFSVRMECDLCRPLGIATWCTEGVIRNIRIRRLTPQEVIDIAEGLR